jgi:hypothetical protein
LFISNPPYAEAAIQTFIPQAKFAAILTIVGAGWWLHYVCRRTPFVGNEHYGRHIKGVNRGATMAIGIASLMRVSFSSIGRCMARAQQHWTRQTCLRFKLANGD